MHITKGKADWIDVLTPGEDDLHFFKNRFAFKDSVVNELATPSLNSKVEGHDNYIFLVHHFPLFDPVARSSRKSEVDFIFTKHQVITAHYEKLEPLLKVETEKAQNSLDLAHSIINSLLEFENEQLNHLREGLSHISSKLFKNNEHKKLLENIVDIKRQITEYDSIIKHQEPALDSILIHGVDFWGPSARGHLNDLIQTNQKITSEVNSFKNLLSDFERTLTHMIQLKTSRMAKTFISLAFISAPFLLIAAVSGVLLGQDPIMDILWYMVGLVAASLISMALYLKKKS